MHHDAFARLEAGTDARRVVDTVVAQEAVDVDGGAVALLDEHVVFHFATPLDSEGDVDRGVLLLGPLVVEDGVVDGEQVLPVGPHASVGEQVDQLGFERAHNRGRPAHAAGVAGPKVTDELRSDGAFGVDAQAEGDREPDALGSQVVTETLGDLLVPFQRQSQRGRARCRRRRCGR